ncbi:MAG: hypothetical protein SFU20_02525 [Chitinophagaceae bacterium]|nr:hypothetical protein [Chitinophagaceae bacterium]
MRTALSALTLVLMILVSCQREVSFENSNTPSDGALQADISGNCQGIVVTGSYKKDTTLNNTNYVDVTVTVATPGAYKIYTDTVNGYYFNATGTFTAAGSSTVRLQATGKPLTAGTNNFTLNYDSTQCFFTVTVTEAGSSSGTSVFTFDGSPNGCTNAAVQGSYTQNVALTSANKVVISVNVSTIGSYSITTSTANGFAFIGLGNFTTTGPQTVELTASGLPLQAGTFTFNLTNGSTTCTFPVTCDAAPVPIDYFPRTANSNWSYEFDDVATDSLLIRALPNTISAGGNTYVIFMGTDDASLGFDSSGYYRKNAGTYYEWRDMGDYFGLDNPLWMEFIFLKDDQAVGHSWTTSNISGTVTDMSNNVIPVTIRMKYEILQKDVSLSVTSSTGTVNHANVIVVEEDYEIFNGTAWVHIAQFGTAKYYYARGKGMIKVEFFDDAGTLDLQAEIRRSVVL